MPFVLPGVMKIPARNSFLEGAMLEPVNTVLKAVKRLALLPGDTVLVAGQGPIGLMFTRLLALRGMNVLATDLLACRLALARRLGARHALAVPPSPSPPARRLPAEAAPAKAAPAPGGRSVGEGGSSLRLERLVRRVTAGGGLDAAVIAVPLDAVVRQAQALLRGGGQVLVFSHTRRGQETSLDLATICVDEKDLMGSYSSDFLLQAEVGRLVFSRQLDVRQLVTHQFPLEQTADAVALAARPTPESLKTVVIAGER
jgi:L-iditol 2-dehydrogenase